MKLYVKSLGVLSIAGILFITSCGNGTPDNASAKSDSSSSSSAGMSNGEVDSSSSKKEDSTSASAIGNTNPDQAIIDYMVPDNKKEIAWLMAGVKMGTSKEVKDHAKKMLADHQKLGKEVAALIKTKNLTEPPVDTVGVVNLTEAKGKDWDKAWVEKMVKDHSDLLNKLNQSEAEVRDSSLKKIVVNTKPVVQSHLDMTKMMQDKMK